MGCNFVWLPPLSSPKLSCLAVVQCHEKFSNSTLRCWFHLKTNLGSSVFRVSLVLIIFPFPSPPKSDCSSSPPSSVSRVFFNSTIDRGWDEKIATRERIQHSVTKSDMHSLILSNKNVPSIKAIDHIYLNILIMIKRTPVGARKYWPYIRFEHKPSTVYSPFSWVLYTYC